MKRSGWPQLSFEEARGKVQEQQARQRLRAAEKTREKGQKRPKQQPQGKWLTRSQMSASKTDPKAQAWSQLVKIRDRNSCQWPTGCKTGDMRIDPHHIAKKSQRTDLRYVVANGICLCRTHHNWTDDNPGEAVKMGLLSTRSRELAEREGTLGEY